MHAAAYRFEPVDESRLGEAVRREPAGRISEAACDGEEHGSNRRQSRESASVVQACEPIALRPAWIVGQSSAPSVDGMSGVLEMSELVRCGRIAAARRLFCCFARACCMASAINDRRIAIDCRHCCSIAAQPGSLEWMPSRLRVGGYARRLALSRPPRALQAQTEDSPVSFSCNTPPSRCRKRHRVRRFEVRIILAVPSTFGRMNLSGGS
jgi:hypothetical protein